jgi:protein-disulfide isomerase
MAFTPLRGGAAALLTAGLAAVAWAQTTGGTSETTGEPPAVEAPVSEAPVSEAPAAATEDAGATGGGAGSGTTTTEDEAGQPAAAAQPPAGDEGEPAVAGNPGYAMGDIVLGDPDAPLTVIEYASFTCPHCGAFATETFPEVKEQYIDTGKVKFILREVYFDQYGLWASMVARCGGEKGFYPLAETYLTTQSSWTRAPDIGHAIHQVGRRAGLSADRLEQCLSDREYAKELLATYQQNMEADEVKSTPTFIIDGEVYTGALGFEQFSEILDAAL